MDLQRIKQVVFEIMGNRYSPDSNEKGEKYYHGERVASLAVQLREYIFPEDSSHDDILTVAAWFHDILNATPNHAEAGAEKTREILTSLQCCSELEVNEICDIISVHDDRNPDRNYSIYVKLHQDADHLDHFGVFDVWRSFIYPIPHDQTMLETLDYMINVRPTQNERFRRELNFDISKKIFDEKMDFLSKFTERFRVECSGKIWDKENLLSK